MLRVYATDTVCSPRGGVPRLRSRRASGRTVRSSAVHVYNELTQPCSHLAVPVEGGPQHDPHLHLQRVPPSFWRGVLLRHPLRHWCVCAFARRCTLAECPLAGYGTYAWAKKYDAWQNSKAGHIALGGSH